MRRGTFGSKGERRSGDRGQRGAALVLTLFLLTTLTVLGVLVLNTSIVETKMANNQKISSQAFYAAEGGLERALAKVMHDFESDSTTGNPWGNDLFAGADTVGITVRSTGSITWDMAARTLDMWLDSPGVRAWSFTAPGGRGGTTVGRANYAIFSRSPGPNEIYFLSYATQPDAVAAVEYHLKVEDLSPYMNALFMGTGLVGSVQGNVNIHGSLYCNGALNFNGNVGVGNNYENDLGGSGQALGTPPFNVPPITDLEAKLRVRGGNLVLDGNAKAGAAGAGPPKHTLAGVYVDGDIPTSGVFADEVSHAVPNIPMPSILDGLRAEYGAAFIDANFPGTADTVRARQAYTALIQGTGPFAPTGSEKTSTGFVVNRGLDLTTAPTGTASFDSRDSLGNGIIWNKAAGTLTIIGNVLVKGTLNVGSTGGGSSAITYTCKGPFTSDSVGNPVSPTSPPQAEQGGMIYATGDVTFKENFTPAAGSGYLNGGTETNSLGIATPRNLNFAGAGGTKLGTGFFYAQGQTTYSHAWKVLGTVITGTGHFDNTPDLYQVPALKNYLPRFMPGGQTILQFSHREWRRVY